MWIYVDVCSACFTPTFQREPVVAHSVTQIPPHHIFYILQRLRLERGVEARPLRHKNVVVVKTQRTCAKRICGLLTATIGSPGRS